MVYATYLKNKKNKVDLFCCLQNCRISQLGKGIDLTYYWQMCMAETLIIFKR